MLEVGDLYAGEERKLLVTLTVPRMAGLGLAKVADVTLRWVALPELAEHTIEAPVHVNVVPGDAAAGRVPDPVVRSELAFQQAQRRKRDAAQAMREGRADDAAALYAEGAGMLNEAAYELRPDHAVELFAEADLMTDFAQRAQWDDHRRVAKASEADSGWKSRKRGR
jgi:Ca-activated chloride channel family protein